VILLLTDYLRLSNCNKYKGNAVTERGRTRKGREKESDENQLVLEKTNSRGETLN
jgi:hypothetical protein